MDINRRLADLCSEAASLGREIDYDGVLQLDVTLIRTLENLPASLRIENYANRNDTRSEGHASAILACATIWHRLFAIVSGS